MDALSDLHYLQLINEKRKSKDRRINYLALDVISLYNNEEFHQRFRMKKESMRELIRMIEGKLTWESNRNYPFPPDIQVITAIRVFRSGSFQQINGDLYSISQPSVSRIVKRVAKAYASVFNEYVQFPRQNELPKIRAEFYDIAKFPGVIGAIDCTHVQIKVNGEENIERFRNRKGKVTLNIQAICDANMKFTNMVIRWPGSVHDSRIFRTSEIRFKLENDPVNGWLLGDSGYACVSYLMTPLLNPKTPKERKYNVSHIKTRNIIERTFGAWKKKFNILKIGIQTKIETSINIIGACAVIWNKLKDLDDCASEDNDDPFVSDESFANLREINEHSNGFEARQDIINRHF